MIYELQSGAEWDRKEPAVALLKLQCASRMFQDQTITYKSPDVGTERHYGAERQYV